MADVIVIAIVAAAVGFTIYRYFKNKKNGVTACNCSSASSCGQASSCASKQ